MWHINEVECLISYVGTIFDSPFNGFIHGTDVDSSTEPIWNNTWICNINSLEILWILHGPVHGIHMEHMGKCKDLMMMRRIILQTVPIMICIFQIEYLFDRHSWWQIIKNVFSNASKIAYSLVESSRVQVCVDNPVESSFVLGEMFDSWNAWIWICYALPRCWLSNVNMTICKWRWSNY